MPPAPIGSRIVKWASILPAGSMVVFYPDPKPAPRAGRPPWMRGGTRSAYGTKNLAESGPIPIAVPREVAENRLPFDEPDRQGTPETAVQAVVAVVPHHEDVPLRHEDRPEVVARVSGASGQHAIVFVDDVRLDLPLAVDVEDLVIHLDRLPLDRDAALDEILSGIHGVTEDDDVSRHRPPEPGKPVMKVVMARQIDVDLGPVEHLVDVDVITDEERPLHRSARDLVGLCHHAAEYEHGQDSDREGLEPLTKARLWFPLRAQSRTPSPWPRPGPSVRAPEPARRHPSAGRGPGAGFPPRAGSTSPRPGARPSRPRRSERIRRGCRRPNDGANRPCRQ